MIFFKHSLITVTVLAIAIWVMPASADTEEKLIKSCESILTVVGYKDSRFDYMSVDKYKDKEYDEKDYQKLNEIFLKIIDLQKKEFDNEKKKKIANELGIRFSNYMKDANPATRFCGIKIDDNRSYLKNVVY